MKLAVFDKEHRILGWFDFNEPLARRPDLYVRIRSANPWPSLRDWIPHDVRHNRRDEAHLLPRVEMIRFERLDVAVARTAGQHYRCEVLVTEASPDELNRLPGFKWFAEEHGVKVENPTSAHA